jgi:excisionase family DNA binding protein
MTDDPVLFIDEVATELRVHPNTVRRHIEANRLKATKQGGRWFIRRSAVDAFMDKGREAIAS